ncbi:hypothetical protein E5843_02820 [Luteimonas yindakuii]|uniref:hypothetical protein n=1 Tax=Luteimonas yindakuii TaxID=2565782 RepID=UPI0011076D0E|nr:hypothetical protein [Luteimonas yindakuii]QCO66973.2 hypothetical protein E5843_02820 [Luteimonas yindakuii]
MIIAGVPAVQLRNAFRSYGDYSWTLESLCHELGVSAQRAGTIKDELASEGFIQFHFEQSGEAYYTTTIKGAALAMASAAKPITRKTADRLVREIAHRAALLNEAPCYVHHVTKLHVFGSYLGEAPDLGDVDIAVELSRKCEGDQFTEACLRYADRAEADGRRFPNFLARLTSSETDLFKLLRGSSRSISLHHAAELQALEVLDTKVIYQYP